MQREKIISGKKFSRGLSALLKQKKYSRHFILCDENTHRHCLPLFTRQVADTKNATVIKIYAGEVNKTLQAAEYVWKRLTEERADRKCVLINLGGGMVCDLGGFAAATYKRGIDFIHVPTTLLSMCDASIGGKQGIDFMHYKNQIGVFQFPAATAISEKFLDTLPPDELKSGFAEVVKHALIAGGTFWKQIQKLPVDLKGVAWRDIIDESVAIKNAVVDADPREMHLRKTLNFGHTIGHAVESLLLDKEEKTFHGYCVAAGIIGELYLSTHSCGMKTEKRDEAVRFIRGIFPPLPFTEQDFDDLLQRMKQDKKNSGASIRMVLLEKVGKPLIDCEVNESLIRDALRYMIGIYRD